MRAVTVGRRADTFTGEAAQARPVPAARDDQVGEGLDKPGIAVLRRGPIVAGNAKLPGEVTIFDIEFDQRFGMLRDKGDRDHQDGNSVMRGLLDDRFG